MCKYMVAALGGYGEFVTAAADIAGALQRAKDPGLPACVNVGTVCLRSPLTEAYLRRKREQSD